MNIYNYLALNNQITVAPTISRLFWANTIPGNNCLHSPNIKPTGDFTFAFRAIMPGSASNTDAPNARWFGIGDVVNNSANSFRVVRNFTDGTRVNITCFNSAGTPFGSTSVSVARNGYATWALTRSGNTFSMYVDGNLITSVAASSVNLNSASFGLILSAHITAAYSWARYYNVALSAVEIGQLDSSPRTSNLVSFWNFQSQTLNVPDLIGSNNFVFSNNTNPFASASVGAGYNALSGNYHTQASFLAQDIRQIYGAGVISWSLPYNINLERIVIGWQQLTTDNNITSFTLRYRINGLSWINVNRQNLAGATSSSGLISQRINTLVPSGQTIEIELTGTTLEQMRPLIGLIY